MRPRDGRVVSNFIVQALKGEPITIYGDGSQTRSFCYVDDLINGFLKFNAAPDELLVAIRKLAGGGRYIENAIAQELALQGAPEGHPLHHLTERDMEIMRLLAEGRSLAEIAAALGVGYKTVANTCSQIKGKLGVARTADLIRLAIEMGVT